MRLPVEVDRPSHLAAPATSTSPHQLAHAPGQRTYAGFFGTTWSTGRHRCGGMVQYQDHDTP